MTDPRRLLTVALADITQDRLREMLERGDVWLVESPSNVKLVERLFDQTTPAIFLGSLSTFRSDGSLPSERLNEAVELIDAHYNAYSLQGDWNELHVIGPFALVDATEAMLVLVAKGVSQTVDGLVFIK